MSVELPDPRRAGGLSLTEALSRRRTVREYAQEPLTIEALARMLWAGQGITGAGGRRTAPSAGAIYPLRFYAVAGQVEKLPAGVYWYDPTRHALDLLIQGDRRTEVAAVALGQGWMADAPVMLVITAVMARAHVEYGNRAGRYVTLEVGHAAQNVMLEAVSLGLGTAAVGAFRDPALRDALGLAHGEEPLYILTLGRPAG
jgi:SagB-type dehydrogenase family enzyme